MISRYDMKKMVTYSFVIEYHSNVWVKAPDTNINTKSTVLCTASSGTVTLTETTTDTMCTGGTITDATSGREK